MGSLKRTRPSYLVRESSSTMGKIIQRIASCRTGSFLMLPTMVDERLPISLTAEDGS
jgi:hypothetical protein